MSRVRFGVLLLALLAAVLVAPVIVPAAANPTPVQVLVASHDYATDVFGDAWDMSDPADINLDPLGATLYVTNQSLSGGVASFSTTKVSYISLLWSGVPGSLPWGRDGRLRANMIDTSVYTRIALHIWSSRAVSVWAQWLNTCANCSGYVPVALASGWNDIDLDLTGAHQGTAWSGLVDDLRLQVMTSTPTTLRLDSARVYAPSTTSQLTWQSPSGRSAQLYWTDGAAPSLTPSQHGGPISGATTATHAITSDLSRYAPLTQIWSYAAGTWTQLAVIGKQPIVAIDSPSAAGCGSYALDTLGHSWNFLSMASLAGYGNAAGLTFMRNGLSATNAAPNPWDPNVLLRLGTNGIDSTVYHRITIKESYAGAFNLADAPGGGTMARVLWKAAGQPDWSQTDDLVTPTGPQTITLDMAMPASILTDPSGTPAQRYAFSSSTPITSLRWDPNEDPGARHWHIESVVLAKDCGMKIHFPVTWHDGQYSLDSTASIDAVSPGGLTVVHLATVAEQSGENSYMMQASAVTPGTWYIRITVHTPIGATSTMRSSGPLVVGRP